MKLRNRESFADFSAQAAEEKEVVNSPKELVARGRDFEAINSGAKTVEMRINLPDYAQVSVGDKLIFKAGDGESVEVKVVRVQRYTNTEEALTLEDITKIAPNKTKDELVSTAKRQLPAVQARQYGVVVFEFEKIK